MSGPTSILLGLGLLATSGDGPTRPAARELAMPRVGERPDALAEAPPEIPPQAVRMQVRVAGRPVWVEPRPAAADAGRGGIGRVARVIDVQQMAFTRESFDQVVFRNPQADLATQRRILHALVPKRIAAVERRRRLADAERGRLALAGTGDIERFFARVAAARRDFEVSRLDYARGSAALERLAPLAREFNDGPFGPGSLFAKTLAATERGR